MGNTRWRGYDHPTMYTMIKSGPGAPTSEPITTYWEGLSKDLDGINTTLNDGLGKLKVGWEGDAAQSAQGGLNPLQQWSTDAQTGANLMRISSEDQATFNSSARSNMPEPVQVTTPEPSTWDKVKAGGAAALGINGPANQVAEQSADHEAQESAQQAAAQKAVQTMETYQSSSEWNTNTLGTFVPSPDVVVSVNPESGQHVTHVESHKLVTPNTGGDTGGTTHASGFVQPNGPTGGIPVDPTHNQPHAPVQTTPTVNNPVNTTPTTPTQTTSPNWAQPPSTTNPTNPVRTPVPTGTNQPFPTDTNPNNGNPNNPNGPGGRGPITGPVNGEPGGPVRGGTPPNGRAPIGPGGNRPGQGVSPRPGGLPGGGGEQVRNPNSRLRPGVGPNALEEGGGRNGGRPGIGGRSASAYSYGESPNGARGGLTGERGGAAGRGGAGGTGGAGRGGVGGAGGAGRGAGAGDGSRGGNRFIRSANAAAEVEEGRPGGRGGNAGANGSKGSGGRMGHGQRGEDEEDYEYQHADYLVDTEDVFLDDRLVAPPVIGDKSGNA
jgi:hypothetical protein